MVLLHISAQDYLMKKIYVKNRDEWRDWLCRHHTSEKEIWLIFYKKKTSQPTVPYEAAVEEALCFGWIDSIIRKIDSEKYARKFTPRKDNSRWSGLNRKRANKMIKEKKMTDFGLSKIKAARKAGLWDKNPKPQIPSEIPSEFAKALAHNKKAKENFDKLAFSYRRHYIGWIARAKRAETKAKRIKESIALLAKGEKLGLK
jgi:uncharacterized protein YdeI (YjbR/CyaY-like superfamily)